MSKKQIQSISLFKEVDYLMGENEAFDEQQEELKKKLKDLIKAIEGKEEEGGNE